jgi:plastocyanin
MAHRNLWRSLATASLLLVSTAAAGLVAAPPASADNNYVIVNVSDAGFSPSTVNAKVGDPIVFVLQDRASDHHTITSDDNGNCPEKPGAPCWPEMAFDDGHPCAFRNFQMPTVRCITFTAEGNFPYYDRYAREAGVDLHGTMLVAPSITTTTTTTVRPPVTTTTAPRTTTTTAPATTTTTGAIQPLLIGAPAPTPTTTFAPVALPVTSAADKAAPAPTTTTTVKDKSKAKAGPATSTTTAPPAPPAGLFDTSTLTPAAPTPDPSPAAVNDLGGSADVNAALAGILHPDKPSDDTSGLLMVLAFAGFAAILLAGGAWAWLHRSSRYFPA